MESDAQKFAKLRLHFVYCVTMLMLVSIAIATREWTPEPKFTEYLANSATMISIVLGLVAIFYSFVSNAGLSQSLGNISTIANDVKDSKEQMEHFLDLTVSSNDAARTNTREITSATKDVNSTLIQLSDALGAIQKQTETLMGSVSALPTRFDQLESKVIDVTRELGGKTQLVPRHYDDEELRPNDVKRFLSNATLVCDLLAYACVLAFQAGKPLNINDFVKAVQVQFATWLSGFLGCMNIIDIIDYEVVTGSPRVFLVKTVHPELVKTARSYFVDYVNQAYADDEREATRWLSSLERVEALFK
jgi:hypothetical protein